MGAHPDRPRRAGSLPRRRNRPHRHAGRRPLRRPALPRRRRQALALGHFQSGHRHRRLPLFPSAEAGIAAGPGLRRPRRGGRPGAGAHARPRRFPRRVLPRRISDRQSRVQDGRFPGGRDAGGFFTFHPPQRRRFQSAGHGAAFHREEHRQRRRPTVQLAGWLQNAVGPATAPPRWGRGAARSGTASAPRRRTCFSTAAPRRGRRKRRASRRSSSPTSRARITATGKSRARRSAPGRSTARCRASSRCPASRARDWSTAMSTATTPSAS